MMSGGAYDYLGITYDLPGLVENMEKGNLEAMKNRLKELGYNKEFEKTEEIEELLNSVMTEVEKIKGVWRAVEWMDSGDTNETEVAKESESFRNGETMPLIVRSAYLFANGNVAVFDENGQQVPELQDQYSSRLHERILDRSDGNTALYGFPPRPQEEMPEGVKDH